MSRRAKRRKRRNDKASFLICQPPDHRCRDCGEFLALSWHNENRFLGSLLCALAFDNTHGYAVIMIRTQISLSEAEYHAAKTEAARLGISLAELLRRALRGALPVDQSKPWMRYAGMIESGDAQSSTRVDEVVYGAER